MQERFKNHINRNFPFLLNTPIALAVSGGIDSMVLLHLCYSLKLNCSVLHCNFALRGEESEKDQQFIEQQCQDYGLRVLTRSFDTKTFAGERKISIQMAARALRYDWFSQQRKVLGFSWVLTAHHADDNLETFLINLSRASGLEGLTGIPETNDYLVRPLLPFSRSEIQDYAKEHCIDWREDASNAETKYIRNKFRHDVIPLLKEIRPMFLENFTRSLSHLNQANTILKTTVDQKRRELFIQTGDVIEIALAELKKLRPLRPYLYELFSPYGFKTVAELEQLLDTLSGKQLYSQTHRLIRNRDHLLLKELEPNATSDRYVIEAKQTAVSYPIKLSIEKSGPKTTLSSEVVLLDKEKLKFPLILRKWENGDYFYPFGMQGKKKLSKYFKDEKFSLLEKENQWLLCNGDLEIIWIVGRRLDDRFKITERTTEMLKITLLHA